MDLPHPVSDRRPHMPVKDRAAQFMPFAALAGYEDAIQETGRITENREFLSEDKKERLDEKLQELLYELERGDSPKVRITYFEPDKKKEGGRYVTASGQIEKINETEKTILLSNGILVAIRQIKDMEWDGMYTED